MPTLEEEWMSIIEKFTTLWQYPNCIGAMDGKHIQIFPPANSGSTYYNYKEGFSVVLLAIVDAEYKFIAVDIGANGKCSDAGIWNESALRDSFVNNTVNLPPRQLLPSTNKSTPPVIIADSGFPMEECVIRPYPDNNITCNQRIYNYRHCRAIRVSENAFGILANRWRILLNRMLVTPEKATAITAVCCALHNLLCSRRESIPIYIEENLIDVEDVETGEVREGLWRKTPLDPLPPGRNGNISMDAKKLRESLKDYFNAEGKVPWQDKCAFVQTK